MLLGGALALGGGLAFKFHRSRCLSRIRTETENLIPGSKKKGIQEIIELRHGIKTAILILNAALKREESRDAHFREDFLQQDDERWLGHFKVRLSRDGEEDWSFEVI